MRNDPRVAEAMRLHKISTRSHHVWQTLRALGEQDERAQAAIDDHTRLLAYLAAEFDKVPSAPVEALPQDVSPEGLYRVINEDDGLLSLYFRTEDEAVAFMERLQPTVEIDEKLELQIATTPSQAGKTENEIDRLETEVARLTAELQEVRKNASAKLIREQRRAIEFGDIVAQQVIAMRSAVVAGELESPAVGLQWIANGLIGPGHYPDLDEARADGGAQAFFDREMEAHDAFRAAHPAPEAPTP